ncbi:hypothetical protein MFLAVUS_008481 [Mucor flavus]|uniref:Uncharacterized protein n=1 Tax=Mucor flavus TaxID=439312 RepID=A0ABP9Z7D7_9FUNG
MNKSSFQPKNPRAVSIYHIDEDDMDDLLDEKVNGGKKMMTGTQALVEFLKTTSPEEFQRTVPERSSNIFARIRKQKRSHPTPPPVPTPSISAKSVPSSTISLPVTINSTYTAPTSYHGSELNNSTSSNARKNYIEIKPQKMVSRSAGNSRSPSFETSSFVSREPILPNKKRESSLYSGSLHYSNSINSKLYKLNDEYLSKSDEMDEIESALLQRLERMKLINHQLPGDQIATGLATEHVRALAITHSLDNDHLRNDQKKNIRHMQVQTEVESNTAMQIITNKPTSTSKDDVDFENRAKRAEAALENALDHFDVITGLAYKKLREIWEEKMRWENACMDLRDRLVVLEQKKFPFQQQQQHYNNNENYYLQEEDELGLSEFPCSE